MKVCLSILLACLSALKMSASEPPARKVFFANSIMKDRYFYSSVSYRAPSWVQNIGGKLPVSLISFTPGNALMLQYSARPGGSWEARIHYHQIRGLDHFEQPTHLVFYLLQDKTGAAKTPATLPLVGISAKDETPIRYVAIKDFITVETPGTWQKISIPLSSFDMTSSATALDQVTFKNSQTAAADTLEQILYIDQVEFQGTEDSKPAKSVPSLQSARGYERHVDIVWQPIQDPAVKYIKIYRSRDNINFTPVGIQVPGISRYADFVDTVNARFYYRVTALDGQYNESTVSNVVDATTRPLTDDELLDMVQEANFRYYWEGAEKHSGLARENIPGRANMIASGASGFGIMALVAGTERGFVSRDLAVSRFLTITSFLEKAEKFHGAFSHFIDGSTGKVEPFFGDNDNGGDLVETSFLMQGLIVAREYFDGDNANERKIRERIDKLWSDVEWNWYRRTSENPFLLWHWSPDKEWRINHKLIGWNETMITYFLAIASTKNGVPASMYYSGWASQSQEAQQYRMNWGETDHGSRYTNGNTYYGIPLPVGVSTGGPLFFVHYSYLGLDPRAMQDAYTNYFTNNRNIALINYRYCIENPEGYDRYGADCWGLSASDGPWQYSANEPVPAKDEGKMTPTGALASFPYTPEESMAALRNYYRNMGSFLWGEYGFRDAFNLDEGWCSEIFMGLNQGPVLVMIENHRSGLIWGLFMENKDVKTALQKIRVEKAR
jgi:exo beta-1,2-glucooligosaccharide sophorohydrolase (non-reducing end)